MTNAFPSSRLIIRLGAVLFLLGLLTGFAAPFLQLPRMGLSSHLEGVMNGVFLMVVGLFWERLNLRAPLRLTAFCLLVYAGFANWLATLVSAATGAAGMMPLAGGGAVGEPVHETIVTVLLFSLSFAVIIGAAILIYGLRPVQGAIASRGA